MRCIYFYSFLYMIKDNLCRYIWLRFYLFALYVGFAPPASTTGGRLHYRKSTAIPEVGIKGRSVPPALSATAPLQQMKKTDMERLGVSDVADAVRHFSGVSVKDYGGVGGLKTVSVRSLGAATYSSQL